MGQPMNDFSCLDRLRNELLFQSCLAFECGRHPWREVQLLVQQGGRVCGGKHENIDLGRCFAVHAQNSTLGNNVVAVGKPFAKEASPIPFTLVPCRAWVLLSPRDDSFVLACERLLYLLEQKCQFVRPRASISSEPWTSTLGTRGARQ